MIEIENKLENERATKLRERTKNKSTYSGRYGDLSAYEEVIWLLEGRGGHGNFRRPSLRALTSFNSPVNVSVNSPVNVSVNSPVNVSVNSPVNVSVNSPLNVNVNDYCDCYDDYYDRH